VGGSTTTKAQETQQDPDTLRRLGGWLFRYRTSIPLPIALALLLIPARDPASPYTTSLFAAGVLVVAAGEGIRLWAVHHIGAISRTRSDRLGPLIDTGPFGLIRNPLYVGNILLWLGFALSARLPWVAPIIVALLAFEYHAIVRWEESLLASRMGDPYRDYMARVPRWIPGFASTRVHESYEMGALRLFSWKETLYSERGTLVAIALGYTLLAIKKALGFGL